MAVTTAMGEYRMIEPGMVPFEMETVPEFIFPNRDFKITDYGAKAGEEKCTAAFAKAIADCASAGGGRVVVPKGSWHTGPIHLKSNVELHLEEGAIISLIDCSMRSFKLAGIASPVL